MKCGHLFNGIGGFALATHWMGWENVMHCEIDPFCNRVMNYHFPNSIQHEDIRTTDFSIYRGKLDMLTGGFPCQPYSISGQRKGKEDERHLWPEMLRAIREIQPGWVVGENVRGLTNWNGGMVFDEVQADLEAEGYKVLPFLLPAAGVNSPHRRDRIWFVAHSRRLTNNGRKGVQCSEGKYNRKNSKWEKEADGVKGLCQERTIANSSSQGLEGGFQSGGRGLRETPGSRPGREPGRTYPKTDWGQFPTVSPLCNRNDGLSLGLARISVSGKGRRRLLSPVESYGRWKKESIKALGNAIVPQVALMIFKSIQEYEKLQNL